MIVQVTLEEGGQWLDVVVEPLEFLGIIETSILRGYKITALKFVVEDSNVSFVYDSVLKGHSRVSPWRIL